MLKLLTFSSLYPNPLQPAHGVFVEERLRHLLATGEVGASVVAPVPWFPFTLPVFGEYASYAQVPSVERRDGIDIYHPRYAVIPKIGMGIAAQLMTRSLRRFMGSLLSTADAFDVIDAHYFYPDGVCATLLGRRLNIPVVITARGSDINVIAAYRRPRRLIVQAAGRAAHIVAVSAALKDRLIELGVAPGKVSVLRNGVDLDKFRPLDPAQAKRDLGLAGRVLLIVSHLKPGKGHDALLEATQALSQTTLVVVGDGPLRASMEARARGLNIADRVRFAGAVAHSDLPRYYSAADAFVLPSEREGMPNVVLEALACGVPVVATRVGGIPEIVTSGRVGILIDDSAAGTITAGLEALFRDYPDRKAIRGYAEQFDWAATSRGLLGVFGQIAGGR